MDNFFIWLHVQLCYVTEDYRIMDGRTDGRTDIVDHWVLSIEYLLITKCSESRGGGEVIVFFKKAL